MASQFKLYGGGENLKWLRSIFRGPKELAVPQKQWAGGGWILRGGPSAWVVCTSWDIVWILYNEMILFKGLICGHRKG